MKKKDCGNGSHSPRKTTIQKRMKKGLWKRKLLSAKNHNQFQLSYKRKRVLAQKKRAQKNNEKKNKRKKKGK